jgi:hypothetical protein
VKRRKSQTWEEKRGRKVRLGEGEKEKSQTVGKKSQTRVGEERRQTVSKSDCGMGRKSDSRRERERERERDRERERERAVILLIEKST